MYIVYQKLRLNLMIETRLLIELIERKRITYHSKIKEFHAVQLRMLDLI